MKKNLDYYAILRVRPDASPDEIKSSYRKLMVTMRKHPDLGGDHETAALINEAYQVLGDEEKRENYAREAFLRQAEESGNSTPSAKRQLGSGGKTPVSPFASAHRPSFRRCPLCGAMSIQYVGPETRCQSCFSPLSPPPTVEQLGREADGGRRLTFRASKSNPGTIYPPGRPLGLAVSMRDLSLSGMSFYSEIPLEAGQVLQFRDATLEAVISVVSCRKRDEHSYSIHARLLTAAFHIKDGVFVSTTG